MWRGRDSWGRVRVGFGSIDMADTEWSLPMLIMKITCWLKQTIFSRARGAENTRTLLRTEALPIVVV